MKFSSGGIFNKKSKKTSYKIEKFNKNRNPERDWGLLLLFFLTLLIGISFMGYRVYINIVQNGDAAFEKEKYKTINEEKLNGMIDIFSKKEELFEKHKKNPITIIDPSQ